MTDSPEDEVPETQCPRCGRWEPDYDGLGVLAHIQPAYEHGCGYCSHPCIDDGRCGLCGSCHRDIATGDLEGAPRFTTETE